MKFLLFSTLFLAFYFSITTVKSNKIKSNLSKTYFNNDPLLLQKTKITKKEMKTKPTQHYKILKLIIGTIIFFVLISIYRLYEEIYQLKKSHLVSKYCNVIDFDPEKMCIQDVQEKLTFVSGKLNLLEPANDDMMKYKNEEKFVRIKREVAVYNYLRDKWELIKDIKSLDEELFSEVDYLNFEQIDHIIKLSYEDNNYIFPNIFTANLEGKAQLNSINLSSAQIRGIQSKEKKLDIINFKLRKQLNTNLSNTPGGESEDNDYNFSNRIIDNDIFIYPISDDQKCYMRIRYYGYNCEGLSILSEVKDASFKTYRIPFDYNKFKENDVSKSINKSSDMKINPNIRWDFFNVILCLCLSGPPTYTYNDFDVNDFEIINPTSINWVFEEELTLSEVLQEKHLMTRKRVFLNRLMFLALFFFTLTIFWELVLIISNQLRIKEEIQQENFLILLVFITFLTQISIIIFSKISMFLKNFITMSVCCGLVLFCLILLVSEIIELL